MKRLMDVLCSAAGLLLLSPVFLFLSVVIICDSRGGVFFRGERVGLYGRTFRIFKFRSMIPDSEGNGRWNVGDKDSRITRVGHFLRKSKLDELPQLINIFMGDMTFVGPRPELRIYVAMYTKEEKRILDLKPGITDWASITNFEQFKGFTQSEDPDAYYVENIRPLKIKLQLYYRDHRSFWADIRCLVWTLYKVLTRSKRLPREIQLIVDDFQQQTKINLV